MYVYIFVIREEPHPNTVYFMYGKYIDIKYFVKLYTIVKVEIFNL